MGRLAAGEMRERITLLTPGPTAPDGRGGFMTTGPGTQTTVSARVVPLSGARVVALGQTLGTQGYEVSIRTRPGAEAGQLLTWKGRTLRIQAAAGDETREYLTLTCFDSGK